MIFSWHVWYNSLVKTSYLGVFFVRRFLNHEFSFLELMKLSILRCIVLVCVFQGNWFISSTLLNLWSEFMTLLCWAFDVCRFCGNVSSFISLVICVLSHFFIVSWVRGLSILLIFFKEAAIGFIFYFQFYWYLFLSLLFSFLWLVWI